MAVLNPIERLGRALLAQLSPLTGQRAIGVVTVTATTGGALPANTYLLPVVGGQLRDDLPFKTVGTSDPVDPGDPISVPITSNAGGARHNLPAGTVFRFDPPLEGFEPTATLEASMVDAGDAGAVVRKLAWFEDLDSANPGKDIFDSLLLEYPAIMLAWQGSEPAEGTTSGLQQGGTRARRQIRFWREAFVLYVVCGRLRSDSARRQQGLLLMHAVTDLLTDRKQNDDGEQLSDVGAGVDIFARSRYQRRPNCYVYAMRLRANQTVGPAIDRRTWTRWALTALDGALPGRTDPEPTDPLTVVDVDVTMP